MYELYVYTYAARATERPRRAYHGGGQVLSRRLTKNENFFFPDDGAGIAA